MKKILPEIKKILSVKDLPAKIICVLLAIILWAYIGNTNIGETQFKIPITFTELPDTLIRSKISNRYVTIILTGKKDILKNINIKNIKAQVDLEKPKVGKYDYPIEINKDELPENIDIKLSHKTIAVTIEKKFIKRVKVKVNISVANKTGRIVKEVPFDKTNLSGISIDTAKVKVIIPIIESANLFKFEKKVIIKNKNENFKYLLSNEEVNVFLQSENPEIEPFEEDIEVFIDVSTLNIEDMFKTTDKEYIEKNFSVNVTVKKPGLRIISIVPDVITVKIMQN